MATRRIGPGGPRNKSEMGGAGEVDEGPSEADLEKFGGVTRPCPECGTDLYDDASICWKCGHALSHEAKGVPMWVIITAAVLVLAFVVFAIR